LVPQFVSSSEIIAALARVPGYVPSLPPVCDITLEHPQSKTTPLNDASLIRTFLIITQSSLVARH
jgi:hypothetical protein